MVQLLNSYHKIIILYKSNSKIKNRNDSSFFGEFNIIKILLNFFLLSLIITTVSSSSVAIIKYKGSSTQKLVNCGSCEVEIAASEETRRYDKGITQYNSQTINIAELYWASLNKFTYLFCGCRNIIEIDLTRFNTINVVEMTGMFKDCSSLISVNLKGFVSYATHMGQLFLGCSSLTSLDLTSLIGASALYIDSMFNGCSSLVSLNLTNFNGQNVKQLGNMFTGCKSLVSIDMSSFRPTGLTWMDNVFKECTNLQYINLQSVYTNQITRLDDIFKEVPKNFVICLNPIRAKELYELVNAGRCAAINCSDNWTLAQNKFTDDGACVKDCISVDKYEYKSKCYTTCPIGTLPNTNMMCKDCDLETNCKWCSLLDAANDLCISCSEGYFQIYNSSNINNTYKICYDSPKGYYLDRGDSFYKPCYSSCGECNVNGNDEQHNCIKCKPEYIYEIDYYPYINCYQKCDYYHYKNIYNNKSYCTKALQCPEDYSKLLVDLRECVINCNYYPSNPYYEFRNKCYKICPLGLTVPRNDSSYFCVPKYIYSLNNKSQLVLDIQEYLFYVFDGTEVDLGQDLEIQGEGIFIEITTPRNQVLNEKANKTTINLGKCESILRKENNIYNKNEQLYIMKIDIEEKGMKIPIIDYEVYFPTNGLNLQKLNLSQCDNLMIDLSIPVQLDKELFYHNASDEYYNNKCIRTTSDSGTDITLKDRQNEFIEQNLTLCEENCKLINYDFNTNKAKCNCQIKIELPIINDEVNIDKKKLKKSFINYKEYFTNIDVVKCYKIVFTKLNLKNNLGFFISLFIILLLFICFLIFYCKSYKDLKMQIFTIVLAIKNTSKINKFSEKSPSTQKPNNIKVNINNIKTNKIYLGKNNINNKNIKNNKLNTFQNIKNRANLSSNVFQEHIRAYLNKKNNNNFPPIKNNKEIKTSTKSNINHKQNKIDNTLYQKYKKILEYNDSEKNELSYENALKYDKRSFIQYYYGLLKIKNLFIFAFFPNRDYNSRIIKIFLLFLSFYIDLTVNALYFDDDTMHKIYEDKGKFDFIYQIPQIVFSSLISTAANNLISYFGLSEKDILEIKNLKDDKNKDNKNKKEKKEKKNVFDIEKKVLKKLKVKFALFFFITLIILLLFGFYISCFCGVYKNTQIHLITDSGISFGVSLIIPFIIDLFPGIFRIPSLRAKNKNRNIMYKLSTILEIF